MEETKESYWEAWIDNNTSNKSNTAYDKLAEIAVYSYNLRLKSRKEQIIDKRHCFVVWWSENKEMFNKYNTLQKVSKLLKIHHATTLHYLNTRKKSLRFKENVSCLLDTLTS
jgi:hypothetical protein